MTGTKTVSERLREITPDQVYCEADYIEYVLTGERKKCSGGCKDCFRSSIGRLADAIEAEQSERQLSEGIEWPRFEDGEMVKFGDEFIAPEYGENEPQKLTRLVLYAEEHFPDGTEGALWDANYLRPGGAIGKDYRLKRPEPEVLDADGVPIKVGDTVWHEVDGSELTVVGFRDEKEDGEVMVDVEGKWFCVRQFSLTHRKPDTFKSVVEEMLTDFDSHDTIELDGYFARLRVLMGGE